jgi:hypothetical protein
MIIIELNPDNYYADRVYDALYTIFYYMAEYLPGIFLHTIKYNGEKLQIPKVITKQHYDSLNADTRSLLNELAHNLVTWKMQ